MIVDKLENIRFYSSMLKNLEHGLEAVAALKCREVGRYEFEGGYFMVQKGSTRPMEEGTFEVHRKYVDIQIVVEGSEEVAWKEITELTSAVEYDPEKDVERLNGSFEHVMKITEGMFYAVFPHDGHKPVSHTKEAQKFTKIVMKLPAF